MHFSFLTSHFSNITFSSAAIERLPCVYTHCHWLQTAVTFTDDSVGTISMQPCEVRILSFSREWYSILHFPIKTSRLQVFNFLSRPEDFQYFVWNWPGPTESLFLNQDFVLWNSSFQTRLRNCVVQRCPTALRVDERVQEEFNFKYPLFLFQTSRTARSGVPAFDAY